MGAGDKGDGETIGRDEEVLRAICDVSNEGIMIHDGGVILSCNAALGVMFGYEPESLKGRSVLELAAPDYQDFVRANYESKLPLTYLVWGTRSNGTRFRAEIRARTLSAPSGELRVAVIRDLSGSDAAAGERATTVSLLRATLDSTTDGILVVDIAGLVTLYNERFLKLWKIPIDKMAAATDVDAMKFVAQQLIDPASFFSRVSALYHAPETESIDTLEFTDGRLVERYSRPQRIGDRIIGRVWSFRDVTAQRRAEHTLELAVQMRDEFLGIASHELFTPITSLAVAIRGLRDSTDATTDEALRTRLFRNAERQVARLARLVQELLDVTRIDGGRMGLIIDDVDLCEVARDVLERFAPELQRDQIEAHLSADQPVVGRWDRTRLEQVATNLVGNAIKFGRGRPIHLTVSLVDGRGELAVRDQGIGIAHDQQTLIFERFQRAVSSRHFAGLGLGLYITRQIVESHGGTLRLQSVEGEGSSFTVRLPMCVPGEVRP
ncbi:MAG: ATP-binding protein [Polyangia bacterium]